MKPAGIWAVRGAVLLFATPLLFWSWRIAEADFFAHTTSPTGDERLNLDRAIQMFPSNANFLLSKALLELDSFGTPNRDVRTSFQEVLRLNPGNAEALMNLGLLAQRDGKLALAERYLLDATKRAHLLKPYWTLANFYFQTNQFSKMFPVIRESLEIVSPPSSDLTRFDVSPIFDLCWRAGATPQQLLDLTPHRKSLLFSYYFSAMQNGNIEAALLVFPLLLPIFDPAESVQRNALSGLCGQLLVRGRTAEAVAVWNQLVKSAVLKSTPLNPARGESMADPGLKYGFQNNDFGWQVKSADHLQTAAGDGWIQFSFDGKQQERVLLMTKNLPVLGGRTYKIVWKATSEAIAAESGLAIGLASRTAELPVSCPALLSTKDGRGECRFTTPAETDLVRMEFRYERPLGSKRLQGTVKISGFDMELIQ